MIGHHPAPGCGNIAAMSPPVIWTPEMDSLLLRMREQGHPWARIGLALGLGHGVVRRRARALEIATARLNSGPLAGVAIAAGRRPAAARFRPWTAAHRLGRRWQDPED